MLIRAIATVAALACPGPTCTTANEEVPPTTKTVTAAAQCHRELSSSCVAAVSVKQNGQPVSAPKPPPPPVPPPSPPPTCHYVVDFTFGTFPAVKASDGPKQIVLSHQVCQSGGESSGTPFEIREVEPASPAVSAQALADQASEVMDLPLPQVSLSPATDATQYVGLPLWAWTPASAWAPKSVTVSAGGVSLTMTATPMFSVWSMGDGGSVTCRGPGTPYPSVSAGKAPRSSPDCGYTYTRSSAAEAGGVFGVQVTTHWKVAWSTTTGLSGSAPDLTASSSLGLHVSEIQALVTDVRP